MSSAKHREVKFTAAEMAEEPPAEIDFRHARILGRGKAGLEAARRFSRARRLSQERSQKVGSPHEYTVIISRDSDGWLFGTVAELDGCHTQAKTMVALMRRIKEAIAVCVSDNGPEGELSEFVGIQRIAVNE